MGRVGTRSLADPWYGGWGPRIGFAYSWNDKTVIRGSYGRAFGQLMAVTGSTHNMGFTLTQTFTNQNNGIQPTYLLGQGMPPWTAPPFINPSVSNNASVSWFQGQETTRLPETNNINLSIQRQLSSSMILEASYNAVIGSHLQAQLLDYNQINPKYLTAFGSIAQSTTVLNSQVGSATAIAAGIVAPYAGFKGTVKQALRPSPQYTYIDTFAGQGDQSGHSAYHAGIIRLEKRYSRGLTLQTSYVFSKILTNADSYWGNNTTSTGNGCCVAADQFNRSLEKGIGQFDGTHNFKAGFVYDVPFGKGRAYLNHGPAGWLLGNWGLNGALSYASGQPVGITSSYVLPLYGNTPGRTTPYVTSYSGWQPDFSNGFDPTVNNFFGPYKSGPFPAQGSGTDLNGFGNATRYNPKVRQFPNYNENLSVSRSFPIRESTRLEFRAEGFNVFNRVRFGTGSVQLSGRKLRPSDQ